MNYNFIEDESDLCIYTFEPILSFIRQFNLDKREVLYKLTKLLTKHKYIINDEDLEVFKKTVLDNIRKRRNYSLVLCSKKNKNMISNDISDTLNTTYIKNQKIVNILLNLTSKEVEDLSYNLNIFLPILINIRQKRIQCTEKIYDSIINKKPLL